MLIKNMVKQVSMYTHGQTGEHVHVDKEHGQTGEHVHVDKEHGQTGEHVHVTLAILVLHYSTLQLQIFLVTIYRTLMMMMITTA